MGHFNNNDTKLFGVTQWPEMCAFQGFLKKEKKQLPDIEQIPYFSLYTLNNRDMRL